METQSERLEKAYRSVRDRVGEPCEIALILGSGLGQLAKSIQDPTVIPYGEIAGFPVSTAPGHAGQLVFGELMGRRVVAMEGRLHLYEGWSARDVALAVYLLQKLGAKALVITNAAGALNPEFDPGDVMLITDHINLTGQNPLVGANDECIGLRFPDLSKAYSPALLRQMQKAAEKAGVEVHSGIYAGVLGPSLETSAERRLMRAGGADAVGMSTVCEVIAAAHAGLLVTAFSAITNKATGGEDQQPDTIEDVLENAAVAGQKMEKILKIFLTEMTL